MSARFALPLLVLVGAAGGGCATIATPEGGARDTVAPKLVSSIPADRAVNVRNRSVVLEFSEPVQVKDLSKNLLVAPLLADDNKYTVREGKNTVTLDFDKPFEPNTTYSFNFRDAITDITENTPARDVSVSFSTGAVLDSGAVQGRVVDLLSSQPSADVSVVLYPETDTANVRRGRPYYLARTDKGGRYQLRNLREGRYRLFALADKNQSSRYEEGEKIGYLPEPITIKPGTDSVQLQLTRPDARRALVTSQKSDPLRFVVGYNEGLHSAVISPLGAATTSPNEALQLIDRGRSVALYKSTQLPEGRYLLASTDSAGNSGRDTLNVKFTGTTPTRRPPAWQLVGSSKEVYRQGLVAVQFTEPLRLVPDQPIGVLVEDSTRRRPLRLPADATLSPDRTLLTVKLNSKANKSISLQLDSTVVTAISGRSLGLKPLRFTPTDQSPSGTLAGRVQTTAKRFELQLLDDKHQLVRTLDSPRTFRFDNLAPGTYHIRVFIDTNADGRWQGPDPNLRRLPEPVFNLQREFQVRANWEEEDIQVAF
ncbi:Ig-like domain-containing protein [Hymenobacter guriensis]|uniref:Ig-like domain-containing protein n=1 Tax=Hymenobacter guriensis TaxID=2793065 RepID=A0ABS0L597_9BACT|nr:Ig-like domain-containing protein [Hymenobacter guriensis]MBG8554549.1 Ig-like domain-containing protein [Hymenobacter guriensis]